MRFLYGVLRCDHSLPDPPSLHTRLDFRYPQKSQAIEKQPKKRCRMGMYEPSNTIVLYSRIMQPRLRRAHSSSLAGLLPRACSSDRFSPARLETACGASHDHGLAGATGSTVSKHCGMQPVWGFRETPCQCLITKTGVVLVVRKPRYFGIPHGLVAYVLLPIRCMVRHSWPPLGRCPLPDPLSSAHWTNRKLRCL